eukprot:jgi/Ulvmu1/1734/UM117_0011.1
MASLCCSLARTHVAGAQLLQAVPSAASRGLLTAAHAQAPHAPQQDPDNITPDLEQDAYATLVQLAVEKDPSLATLATQHLSNHSAAAATVAQPPAPGGAARKAPWLRQRAAQGERYKELKSELSGLRLATVCEEAQCPNIGECWNGPTGTATVMLMGDTCTRGCRFCAVNTSLAPAPLDEDEPENTAQAVSEWGVGYIVLTSVDRDDVADGGASHFARTVRLIKQKAPHMLVECLAPDFSGNAAHVQLLASSGLDVFAHNIETVHRLQGRVRDRRATYEQSLAVLREAKATGVYTKSSIMLGLGERDDEVIDTLLDLRDCGVDIVTFGQYLQPTPRHLPVQEFVTPAKFEHWRRYGEDTIGFRYVASGPLVRSSYKAGEFFLEAMIKGDRDMQTSP